VTGDRWIFARMVPAREAGFPGAGANVYTAGHEVVAEVRSDAMTTRQADSFQRTLANRLNFPVGSYRTSSNPRRSNPTLVHCSRMTRFRLDSPIIRWPSWRRCAAASG
jgi:hypothetical protein